MSYKKPQVVAKSAAAKSYAAGCPAKDRGYQYTMKNGVKIYTRCAQCEISGR